MPIYLERRWATKFCTDWNFAWCFGVSEVNIHLASGHFQNDGVVQPGLYFWISLAIQFLKNTIGFELGDSGLPKRACKILVYVPCMKVTAKGYGGMWDPIRKGKSKTRIPKSVLSEVF